MEHNIDARIYTNGFKPEPTRALRTDTLWALLEDAIDDAEFMSGVIHRLPDHFSWKMSTYVSTYEKPYIRGELGTPAQSVDKPAHCAMCVAGACMIRRGVTYSSGVDAPIDWNDAVDQMRTGDFVSAYEVMYGDEPVGSHLAALERIADLYNQIYLHEGPERKQHGPPPSECLSWEGYRKVITALREHDL